MKLTLSLPLSAIDGFLRANVYKCYVVAALAKIDLINHTNLNSKHPILIVSPSSKDPSINAENVVIQGTNAICRYMWSISSSSKVISKDQEAWIEWDTQSFAPSLSSSSASGDKDSNIQLLLTGIHNGSQFLANNQSLSLADVFVYCSLITMKNFSSECRLPDALLNYLSKVESNQDIKKGIEKADTELTKCQEQFSKIYDSSDNIIELLEDLFIAAIKIAFPNVTIPTNFVAPGSKDAIDYQANCAHRLLAEVKAKGFAVDNVGDVAKRVVDAFNGGLNEPTKVIFNPLSSSESGFINVTIKDSYIAHRVNRVLVNGKPPLPKLTKKLKIGVDFSSPNVAKEMHVGHLRSTIIGDAIASILEHIGHDVKRINHVGDWGTQFGMLLSHLDDTFGADADVSQINITDLTQLYRDAKKRFDEDEEFKKRAHDTVVHLQAGRAKETARWKKLVELSSMMFDQIYNRLGVKFPDGICGESFYNKFLPSLVEELKKKGFITTESNGAELFFTGAKRAILTNRETKEDYEIPMIVRKGDGGFGYDATDGAAIRYRLLDLHMDWVIYVTDTGQQQHFEIIFEAARKAGWANNKTISHANFGLVLGKGGGKIKTRSGESEKLVDLLDEAVDRMHKELVKRINEEGNTTTIKLEEARHVAEQIGYAAIKYADLRSNRERDYVFDYDAMLQADGDTAVYLQYTYARLCSIERKAEKETQMTADKAMKAGARITLDKQYPIEWALALHIARYPEYINKAVRDLHPHVLCDYVHKLAVYSSKFLNEYRILQKSPGSDAHIIEPTHGLSRLMLVKSARLAILDVFQILGFAPLERI